MKKASVVVAVSLGLFATLWMVPTVGADPRGHGRSAGGRFGGGHSFHAHGPSGHKHGHSFHKHGFGHHRFSTRHFITFGAVVSSPVVVYSSPPLFYAAPLNYSAPVFAPPAVYSSPAYSPPAYSPPPPAPPAPRVVEYLTGRYELRGDGIRTPYTWVWIPNPPPPPAAPPAGAPMSGDAPPARRTQVYRWVDEQGVVHWTDRSVPRRYREEGKPFKPS
jgi:hypothetical protein